MNFSLDPYLGPTVEKNKNLVRIVKKKGVPKSLYAVVLPKDRNALELYAPKELTGRYFKESDGEIIGYAVSREEGLVLMASLLAGAYRRDGLGNLRNALLKES